MTLPLLFVLLLAQGASTLPRLTEPVHDFAGVIDEASAAEMDRRIRALQRATGDVIAVVTVDTFAPYADIDEYAVRLFENHGAGIGQKGKDNGALIVVAVKDRMLRIEVGYALEEFITDGFAGETRDTILAAFRRTEYGPGLLLGVTRLINRVAERRGVKLEEVPATPVDRPAPFPFTQLFLFALIVFFILNSVMRRRPRRRFWGRGGWSGWSSGVGPFGGGHWGGGFGGFGGGGRGGGFGGFGGGRSGGGGASGGW
ncbi:MAG TPA: TPM domain-containing protein [Vicinamibacterales bacterium]|nr:TPM domain-containing protein [Vicinamibacterales bacterium]